MRGKPVKMRHIVPAVIAAFLILLFLILGMAASAIASGMVSQNAAERWGEGSNKNYAQISCFLSVDAAFKAGDIPRFRISVDSALKEASVTADNPSAKLWIDAYSTEAKFSAKTDRGSIDASVTAVGGDFFTIHPMKYLYGYAFSPDDIMRDRVVLDTDAAWQLFGSFDIVGRAMTVSGKNCIVAGVAERKNDEVPEKLFSLAYGDKPRIFISYDLLESIRPDTPVSCYEAVLPAPVSGFGIDLVKSKIGIDSPDAEIIENSARYDFLPLTGTIRNLPVRSMRSSRIIYPYWENTAGVIEDYLALILLVRILCAAAVGLAVFVFSVKFMTGHRVKREKLIEMKDGISAFIMKTIKKINNLKNTPPESKENKNDSE